MKKFINILLFFLALFKFIGITYAQNVYMADKPLPQLVAETKQKLAEQSNKKPEDIEPKKIRQYLKKENLLQLVTKEIAKEKFKIEWLDNDNVIEGWLGKYDGKYPDVAICYMGERVGYGLFAMQQIEAEDIIAEYTGKHITVKQQYKENEYCADTLVPSEKIDASTAGNAARFAQYLMNEKTLFSYGYTMVDHDKKITDVVATSNACLIIDRRLTSNNALLRATRDIQAFEQIGYMYDAGQEGCRYGFSESPWFNEPALFDKNGQIISPDKYTIKKAGLMLVDISSNYDNAVYLELHENIKLFKIIEEAAKNSEKYFVVSYLPLPENHKFIIDVDKCKEEVKLYSQKVKNRVTIYGYVISNNQGSIQTFLNKLTE